MVSTSARKHRVLIYTTCYNVLDGVTLTLRKIEEEVLSQGHSVCILSTNSGNSKNTNVHMDESQEFQRYRHLPHGHPNRTVIFLDDAVPIPFLHNPYNPDASYRLGFSLSNDVRKKLNAFEPTIVHITVPDVTCMHLIEFAREKQLPLMGTYHSNIPDYFTHYPGLGWLKYVIAGYERHQYNFLQALFAPTPFIQKHLAVEDHYQFDKITNVKVWGRGVDLERFHPSHRSEDFRARYGFAPNDVVVLWVGRLVPEKRPDIFAQVIRRLANEGVSFKALVVGSGPSENEVKSLPNTVFAGWMTGDELAVAYASSDVFLFPSAVETFGNVTLEAAASGLPLVVDSGCSGHLVRHGINGFACTEEDLDSYYNGTLSLVSDNARREKMSIEGRELSLSFEKRTVCRRMIDNYTNVTQEFYRRYRGKHANRDLEYENKPTSFRGGCYVRPISLKLMEFIFIVLFRIFYRVGEFLARLKAFNTGTNRNQPNMSSEPLAAKTNNVSLSPSTPSNNAIVSDENALSTKPGNNVTSSPLSVNEEMAYLNNLPIDDQDSNSVDDSILSCDASSSSCNSSSPSTKETDRAHLDRLWRCELPISHNIAILVLKNMSFQGRVECRVRKWFLLKMTESHSDSSLSFSSKRNERQRKRKCSEEFTPDDLKEALLSNSCCSSTVSSRSGDHSFWDENDTTFLPTSTSTEEGLNSRRVKSSSTLQV